MKMGAVHDHYIYRHNLFFKFLQAAFLKCVMDCGPEHRKKCDEHTDRNAANEHVRINPQSEPSILYLSEKTAYLISNSCEARCFGSRPKELSVQETAMRRNSRQGEN